jgi:hypothetical protein
MDPAGRPSRIAFGRRLGAVGLALLSVVAGGAR